MLDKLQWGLLLLAYRELVKCTLLMVFLKGTVYNIMVADVFLGS